MNRKLILYIAMILTAVLLKEMATLTFYLLWKLPMKILGMATLQNIDTVIWGRKTFDKVLSFGNGIPHKDKKVFVISKTKKGKVEHAEYLNNVVDLVKTLKKHTGKNIYCDGGAEIVYELLNKRFFDRIIDSGDGIKLFKDNNIEQQLTFKRSISYPSGLVQLWYEIQNGKLTNGQ